MNRTAVLRAIVVASLQLALAASASAQTLSQRGFVDVSLALYPQEVPRDETNAVAVALLREEVFVRPASWLRLSGGVDLRANSHDQVDRRWRLDFGDRGIERPAIGVRRLGATVSHGPFTVDVGKQFIRWGQTDIVTPTDRFAPRDFMNVLSTDFIGVSGVRGVVSRGDVSLDAAWVPRVTPSRLPLLDQRWGIANTSSIAMPIIQISNPLPTRDQFGVRVARTGAGFEASGSLFDGLNHLPDFIPLPTPSGTIGFARRYARLRSYGGDAAVPTKWVTVKGEVAWLTAPDKDADDYVLYVVQLERQSGEWSFVAGYAGEIVTTTRSVRPFAPDRGLTRALVGRASYTLGVNRSVTVESAVRQNGHGFYAKGEYSHARGTHWRATLSGVAIAGRDDDFLGQYRRNSHVALSLRYSF